VYGADGKLADADGNPVALRLGPWPRFLLKRLASLFVVLAMLLVLTFLLITLCRAIPPRAKPAFQRRRAFILPSGSRD